MDNKNTLFTVIGLGALFALLLHYKEKQVVENWQGILPRRVLTQQVMDTSDGFITVPGQYQAMLAPRQPGMADYGAMIRYNMPDQGKLGTSMGSLNYASMVSNGSQNGCGNSLSKSGVEGFCSGGNCGGCSTKVGGAPASSMKTSNLIPSAFTADNYAQQYNKMEYNETTDILPVQSMAGSAMVNAIGEAGPQPIIYDKLIYANQKSRLASRGDPIRGDLPIVPLPQGWFSPNVNPQIDLRSGAIAAVSGLNNDTSKELMALQTAASAGTLDVGSGVNYAVQKSMYAGAAGNDIKVTAFP